MEPFVDDWRDSWFFCQTLEDDARLVRCLESNNKLDTTEDGDPLREIVGGSPFSSRIEEHNNSNVYLVRPPSGGWLHRSPRLRLAVMSTGPLGSLTPCKL
jgi:hypothetical protein